MGSFSLNFPDQDILAVLGDELTLIHTGGGSEIILGEFDFKYMEDELGNQLDVTYPVFDCGNSDADKFNKDSIMRFDGEEYSFYKKLPIDTGKTRIFMELL